MSKQHAPQQATDAPTSAPTTTKKGVTPPKCRPTRARNGAGRRQRAFGPVLQWITFALLLALVVVVLVLITDGGDFNPFDDGDQPTQNGAASSLLIG